MADEAFAAHCERWPLDRKVIVLKEHEEKAHASAAYLTSYTRSQWRTTSPSRWRIVTASVSMRGSFLMSFHEAIAKLTPSASLDWRPPPYEDPGHNYRLDRQAISDVLAVTVAVRNSRAEKFGVETLDAVKNLEAAVDRSRR